MLRNQRSIAAGLALLLGCAGLGLAAQAETEPRHDEPVRTDSFRTELAPPGRCAGEEPERPQPVAQGVDEEDLRSLGSARHRLSPTDVAAALPGPNLGPPERVLFSGPGACDNPGSGCLGTIQPTETTPQLTSAGPAPAPPGFGFGTGPATGQK